MHNTFMSSSYLDLLHQLHLPGEVDEVSDEGGSSTTHSARPPTPVDVVSNVTWELIVDDMRHLEGKQVIDVEIMKSQS